MGVVYASAVYLLISSSNVVTHNHVKWSESVFNGSVIFALFT